MLGEDAATAASSGATSAPGTSSRPPITARSARPGMDPADNEFVIGLLGPRLDWLSRLVKAMRSTEHTARHIERLGPFFVGRRIGHTLDAAG